MYVPAAFRMDDPVELHRLMREYNFATLVTVAEDGVPFATHLPLLVETDPDGRLFLRSHMARANPQWEHFSNGKDALAVFQGPHALVHSNWYDSSPNVPTWNYAVVHATGRADIIDDAAAARGIAYRLVERHTPDMQPIPPEYEAKLMLALVTFEIPVTRLEGKYKLNQNKTTEDRENVRRRLAASDSDGDRLLAEMMARKDSPEALTGG